MKIAHIKPRFGRAFSKIVPTAETASYMRDFTRAAVRAMGNRPPTSKPVCLTVHAFIPIPESWPMRKREDARIGAIRPTPKPDLDNIEKMVDALKGVCWWDDAPIVEKHSFKYYSDEPGLRIEIRELVPPAGAELLRTTPAAI